MADTIKLKAAIGDKATHLLPFYFWGTGRATRLEIVWKLLQGRTVLWFGKDRKDWGTVPAQEVRDLADEATRLVNALRDDGARHNAEIRRYQAVVETLNAKLPKADRLQKISFEHPVNYVAWGGGPVTVSGGGAPGTSAEAVSEWLRRNPPARPEPPIGYAWPKVDPVEALEGRVAALERLWRPDIKRTPPVAVTTPEQEPGQ